MQLRTGRMDEPLDLTSLILGRLFRSSDRSAQIWVCSGAFLIVLGLLAFFSWRMVRTFDESSQFLRHTIQTFDQIDKFRTTVVMDENVQRNFLLFRNSEVLQATTTSSEALQQQLAALRVRLGDNPSEQQSLSAVGLTINRRMAIFKRAMLLHDQPGAQAAINGIIQNQLNPMTRSILERLDRIAARQNLLLQARTQAERRDIRRALLMLLSGALLAAALIIAATILIEKTVSELARVSDQRQQATARLEELNRSLEERVSARNDELQDNADLLESMFDTVAEGIVVCDTDLRTIRINRAAARLLGSPESKGFDFQQWARNHIIAPVGDSRPLIISELPLFRALRGERPDNVELRVTGPEFEGEVWHEISARARRDAEGRIIGAVAIFRDIGARKQVEESLRRTRDMAIESARLRSEFLANMSHEIRTPLNGIIGMAQLLATTTLDSQQREYADTIWNSSELLLSIVNDVLDFSKIAAGKMPIEQIDFDLFAAIEASADSLAEGAHAKNLEIVLAIDDDVPQMLCGDPNRIRQILTNLIGNAVKFTERGEVIIRVRCVSTGKDSAVLGFEVSDTGIGIAPEAARTLFKPFVQADGSTNRKYGGTGLGLAICAQLVEQMGGEISVSSEPGHGSVFRFTLRLARSASHYDDAKAVIRAAVPAGDRILVASHNTTNRTILVDQLARWGMKADGAADSSEALALARTRAAEGHPYEIALLDIDMPGISGLEVARTIRADPLLSRTKIIMMGSVADPRGSADGHQGVADAWLSKPIKRAKLITRLAELAVPLGATERAGGDIQLPETAYGPPSPAPQIAAQLRLLVVDDEPVNRTVAFNQLSHLGYQADLAEDARSALDRIAKTSFDIILMDCQMPGIDGYEATRLIREREGRGRHATIIAMTAHIGDETRERCIAAGMDDYIGKPVQLETLAATLNRWISMTGRRAEKRLAPPQTGPIQTGPGSDGDSDPTLDSTLMADFCEMSRESGRDEFTELADAFIAGVPTRIERLRGRAAAGDASALAELAHKFSGASASIGASRIARLCRQIEELGKRGSTDGAKSLIDQIEREVANLRGPIAEESARIAADASNVKKNRRPNRAL